MEISPRSSQALPTNADMTPRDLFLAHLPHIEQVARYVARRNRLRPEDAEDFAAEVKLKLIDDDYRVIRMHQGKSSLRGYLSTVVQNCARDFKNRCWGKWRPTAEAERLGELAIRLEELTGREQYTFDEACEILQTNEKVQKSRRELNDLMARLPARAPRRIEGDEQLQSLATNTPSPEERLLALEDHCEAKKALALLRQTLTTLDPEDQVILRMYGEFKIREIAKILGMEERPLYRRIEKLKKKLLQELEGRGVRPRNVDTLLRALKEPA